MPNDYERWDRVDGICALIQKASRNKRFLRLRLRDSELRYRLAPHDEYDIAQRTLEASQTLAHFLRGDHTPFSFHQVKRPEKFALAVVLANALLYLHEGPWCVQYWEATQIFFRKGSNPAVPDFRRPYLLTQCETVESAAPNPQILVHPYPSLWLFGCLLMEMELKRSINSDSFRDVRAAVSEVEDLKAEYGKSFEQYFEAINACLDPNRFKPGSTFQSRDFQDEVYAAIVYPLETVLYEGWPELLGKLSTPADPSEVLKPKMLRSIPSAARAGAPTKTSATLQTTIKDKGPFFHSSLTAALPLRNDWCSRPATAIISPEVSTHDEYPGVFLHDDVHDSGSVDPKKCAK